MTAIKQYHTLVALVDMLDLSCCNWNAASSDTAIITRH